MKLRLTYANSFADYNISDDQYKKISNKGFSDLAVLMFMPEVPAHRLATANKISVIGTNNG